PREAGEVAAGEPGADQILVLLPTAVGDGSVGLVLAEEEERAAHLADAALQVGETRGRGGRIRDRAHEVVDREGRGRAAPGVHVLVEHPARDGEEVEHQVPPTWPERLPSPSGWLASAERKRSRAVSIAD